MLASALRFRYALPWWGREEGAQRNVRSESLDAPAQATVREQPVRAEPASSATSREHVVWLTVILALAFTFRLIWVSFSDWQPTPDDDAFRYDFAARSLSEGHGYIHLNGAPTAFWPPGYPLLLGLTYRVLGASVGVAQLLNVLLSTATVGLVYLVGRRALGSQPALVGAAIVAAFPSLVFFTAVTLSEVTFTFFVMLAVYLALLEAGDRRARWPQLRLLLATGLVLGFASLVRGQALLVPIVLVPFWLRSGIGWSGVADKLVALALGIGLIVAPWTVRNVIELESPVLISTNAGVDFWMGHNEDAAGGLENADELVFSHPELTTPQREVRVNAEGFSRGLKYAVTHPLDEAVLVPKKLFLLYYNDEEGLRWNEGHGGQPFLGEQLREALLTLSNVYYFAVLGFLLLGLPLWFSLRDPGRVLLLSLIAYWTLVHVAFFGDPRFHAPIMPMVALLAALPWVALWSGRLPWARPT